MFFISKKKKIRKYLDDKPKEKYTTFDLLLSDYLDGTLEKSFKTTGLKWCSVEIQWEDDFQMISVGSVYNRYEMDLWIYTDEIVIFFNSEENIPEELEPDACKEEHLPLESKEQILELVKAKLAGLN